MCPEGNVVVKSTSENGTLGVDDEEASQGLRKRGQVIVAERSEISG